MFLGKSTCFYYLKTELKWILVSSVLLSVWRIYQYIQNNQHFYRIYYSYSSPDLCFLSVSWHEHKFWHISSLITVFLAITSYHTGTQETLHANVWKVSPKYEKIQPVWYGHMGTSGLWFEKHQSCKHKFNFLHLISHIYSGGFWDPLIGAQGIFNQ